MLKGNLKFQFQEITWKYDMLRNQSNARVILARVLLFSPFGQLATTFVESYFHHYC